MAADPNTKEITFTENELTGSRVTFPFTALKHLGPKHHAIVVGEREEKQSSEEAELWIAELSHRHGYRLVSLKEWMEDNGKFLDGMKIEPNPGPRSNWEVAESAIEEVKSAADKGLEYNIVFNNCETFANRHLTGETTLSPQVKKAAKVLGFVVAGGALILKKHLEQKSGPSGV